MNADRACLVALVERAEIIRREEIRRCRPLRRDANALAVAEQISASLVAALLRPITVHVTTRDDAEVEQFIRRIFDLPDELVRDVHDATAGMAS